MSRELTVIERAERALAAELETQSALFRELNAKAASLGRKPPYPEVSYAVMSMKIRKNADGTFVVTTRAERLDSVDWDLSGRRASVSSSRSFSERMGYGRNGKPPHQKYGDAFRLDVGGDIVNDAENLEVGEMASMGTACL